MKRNNTKIITRHISGSGWYSTCRYNGNVVMPHQAPKVVITYTGRLPQCPDCGGELFEPQHDGPKLKCHKCSSTFDIREAP